MYARDPQHVRDTRMRSAAPVAALVGPLVLVVLAAINVLLPCAGGACTALERRSLLLLGIAAPGFPALVALPGALPLLVSMVGGAVLSVPLWAFVGRRVAVRATGEGGGGWRGFWRAYAVVFVAWCAIAVVAANVLRGAAG